MTDKEAKEMSRGTIDYDDDDPDGFVAYKTEKALRFSDELDGAPPRPKDPKREKWFQEMEKKEKFWNKNEENFEKMQKEKEKN